MHFSSHTGTKTNKQQHCVYFNYSYWYFNISFVMRDRIETGKTCLKNHLRRAFFFNVYVFNYQLTSLLWQPLIAPPPHPFSARPSYTQIFIWIKVFFFIWNYVDLSFRAVIFSIFIPIYTLTLINVYTYSRRAVFNMHTRPVYIQDYIKYRGGGG